MPRIVDELTESEQEVEARIREEFTEEQMCAYFLTKTVRSLYQFDDDFVVGWYKEMFGKAPDSIDEVRRELVQAYTRILIVEQNFRFILDYWLRQYQEGLLVEMEAFFSGEPGK